jgi:hypothetical protein
MVDTQGLIWHRPGPCCTTQLLSLRRFFEHFLSIEYRFACHLDSDHFRDLVYRKWPISEHQPQEDADGMVNVVFGDGTEAFRSIARLRHFPSASS